MFLLLHLNYLFPYHGLFGLEQFSSLAMFHSPHQTRCPHNAKHLCSQMSPSHSAQELEQIDTTQDLRDPILQLSRTWLYVPHMPAPVTSSYVYEE